MVAGPAASPSGRREKKLVIILAAARPKQTRKQNARENATNTTC
jgi:hypothetical protein